MFRIKKHICTSYRWKYNLWKTNLSIRIIFCLFMITSAKLCLRLQATEAKLVFVIDFLYYTVPSVQWTSTLDTGPLRNRHDCWLHCITVYHYEFTLISMISLFLFLQVSGILPPLHHIIVSWHEHKEASIHHPFKLQRNRQQATHLAAEALTFELVCRFRYHLCYIIILI